MERERTLNYRAGLAPAATYNVNRTNESAALINPMIFFGEKEERRAITDGEIASVLDNVAEVSRQRNGGA